MFAKFGILFGTEEQIHTGRELDIAWQNNNGPTVQEYYSDNSILGIVVSQERDRAADDEDEDTNIFPCVKLIPNDDDEDEVDDDEDDDDDDEDDDDDDAEEESNISVCKTRPKAN